MIQPRGRRFSGERVKQARLALRMSRVKFGRLVGVCDYSVYLWETGRSIPKGESLVRMADALGQTVDYFYA